MRDTKKIDIQTPTWGLIARWARELRADCIESLIKTDREDPAADKLRGKIRLLDELLELPDQDLETDD